jgi:hypothetical protein
MLFTILLNSIVYKISVTLHRVANQMKERKCLILKSSTSSAVSNTLVNNATLQIAKSLPGTSVEERDAIILAPHNTNFSPAVHRNRIKNLLDGLGIQS